MVTHSRSVRNRVVELHAQGLSSYMMAKKLKEEGFDVPSRTLRRYAAELSSNRDGFIAGRRYKRTGNNGANRHGKTPLSDVDRRKIRAHVHGKRGLRGLAKSLPDGLEASRSTVQRICKAAKMRAKHPARKPRLTAAQKRKRLTFANTNRGFPFPTVVYIDEIDIPIDGGKNTHNDVVWLNEDEEPAPVPTTKFTISESRMAVLTFEGGLDLVPCPSHPTAAQIQHCMESVFPMLNAKLDFDYCICHDNCPGELFVGACFGVFLFGSLLACCVFLRLIVPCAVLICAGWKAGSTQEFVEERSPAFWSTEQYPANSPDFNGVENKFAELKDRIRAMKLRTREQLCAAIDSIWAEITTQDNVRAVYDSMPARMAECIKKKGGMTRY